MTAGMNSKSTALELVSGLVSNQIEALTSEPAVKITSFELADRWLRKKARYVVENREGWSIATVRVRALDLDGNPSSLSFGFKWAEGDEAAKRRLTISAAARLSAFFSEFVQSRL